MTKKLILTLLLGLLALPAFAGDIGYASGQSCDVAADSVNCSAVGGRGSLVIEASEAAFVKLRDALTPDWSGSMTCSQCDVDQGFPGCVADGDVVATTRKKAALSRLACVIKSHIIQKDVQDAAPPVIDTNPDIGGGDPG